LGFEVLSGAERRMHPGQLITYRLRPLVGVSLGWVTEITQVEEPLFFVDEQRLGPYRFWHHQHRFTAVEGGLEMEDIVHYALPWGPLGRLAHWLDVRRRLQAIFDYRQQEVKRYFGSLGQSFEP
jgi:ligand-binding SRPBCC domain-containing protein